MSACNQNELRCGQPDTNDEIKQNKQKRRSLVFVSVFSVPLTTENAWLKEDQYNVLYTSI